MADLTCGTDLSAVNLVCRLSGQGHSRRLRSGGGPEFLFRRGRHEWPERRFQNLEELDRERAREVVLAGLRASDIGGDRAVEPLAQEENEGCRTVDRMRGDERAAACEGVEAIVPGAGLAAQRHR